MIENERAIWYRVRGHTSQLPRWFPYLIIPKQDYTTAVRFALRLAAWNRHYRIIGRCENRNAWIITYPALAPIGRFLIWWTYHRWILEEWGIKLGLLRSPIEADYYKNYRFDPPDLWGTPLRRHEGYLA